MGSWWESPSSQKQSQGSADGKSWSRSSSETHWSASLGTSSEDLLMSLLSG